MAITFDEINRVTLRYIFLPWFCNTCKNMGIELPSNWNPSDEELQRLADKVVEVFKEYENEI